MSLLEVEDLTVEHPRGGAPCVRTVRGVSLTVADRECLGVVGESGAGKSQLFLAVMGLLAPTARISGRIRFANEDVSRADPARLARLRGTALTMVFQDALGALTPHLRVGEQLAEVLVVHRRVPRRAALHAAAEALSRVGFEQAPRILRRYPHELSGGECQRVMIAMALLGEPRLLIADEPTSALDVTVQARILGLLESLRATSRLALVLISHDIAVVARVAERMAVMYAGRIVEHAAAARLLTAPRHPYTALLLECAPRAPGASGDGGERMRMPFIPGVPARADVDLEGCEFAPRCPRALERCWRERPRLQGDAEASVACHEPLP